MADVDAYNARNMKHVGNARAVDGVGEASSSTAPRERSSKERFHRAVRRLSLPMWMSQSIIRSDSALEKANAPNAVLVEAPVPALFRCISFSSQNRASGADEEEAAVPLVPLALAQPIYIGIHMTTEESVLAIHDGFSLLHYVVQHVGADDIRQVAGEYHRDLLTDGCRDAHSDSSAFQREAAQVLFNAEQLVGKSEFLDNSDSSVESAASCKGESTLTNEQPVKVRDSIPFNTVSSPFLSRLRLDLLGEVIRTLAVYQREHNVKIVAAGICEECLTNFPILNTKLWMADIIPFVMSTQGSSLDGRSVVSRSVSTRK